MLCLFLYATEDKKTSVWNCLQDGIMIDLMSGMKVYGDNSEEVHRGIYVENSIV